MGRRPLKLNITKNTISSTIENIEFKQQNTNEMKQLDYIKIKVQNVKKLNLEYLTDHPTIKNRYKMNFPQGGFNGTTLHGKNIDVYYNNDTLYVSTSIPYLIYGHNYVDLEPQQAWDVLVYVSDLLNVDLLSGIVVDFEVGFIYETKIDFKDICNTITGIENGTTIYLDNDNNIIDSTKIENNSFVFNSKLSKSPLQVVLRTKDFSHYRFLWVENKPMTFDATKTDFRNAKVTGSQTENLSFNHHQKIDTLPRNERQKLEIEFVKNNPISIVSASMLSVYSTTWGKEKTTELYEQFSKENKESEYGQKIAKYIELNKEPKIGEQFADFEMENQNGEFKKLSDIKGKTVLLEFWASWCGPCRKENPNLVKTYERFNSKGFEIFAVSLDADKNDWIKAIEKDSLNWNHVSDLKGDGNEASLIYGINGIPDNFLIAENGEIIGRNLRGEKLNQKLKEILE